MKDNGQGYLFCKRVFIDFSPVKALEAVEAGKKSPFFKCMSTIFFFCNTKFFERFFYQNTISVRFYWILTYIWSISLCKITQLQESEMWPTGWTLSYVYYFFSHNSCTFSNSSCVSLQTKQISM